MEVMTLECRADRLFGRHVDLARLRERASHTGMTAIVGAPQIGKSWVLMELARQLDREVEQPWLVGFTRSPRGAQDPLLQVVSDLYQRWLADAGAWARVKAVWGQQKEKMLPAFVKFVGNLTEKSAKLLPVLGEVGGAAIRESLEGLIAAREDLRTGRLVLSRLEYTQALELVNSVLRIAERRIALVMDQWEETRDLDNQCNAFRDFLREPEQWPGCHIFLGVRLGTDAANALRDLCIEYPGTACIYPLFAVRDRETEGA
ncbi:MAG TPA: hypothetical protein VKB42_10460, partial [Dongiaceae bacterium]|nr:hypothetical protein [Dongiaceae bacterium]